MVIVCVWASVWLVHVTVHQTGGLGVTYSKVTLTRRGQNSVKRRHWRGDLCPSWDTFATRLIRGKRSVDKEVPVSEVSAGAARPRHSNVSATFSPPLPHAHSPPTPAPCLRMNIKTNAWTNPSAGHTHSHITLNLLPLLLELSVQMPFVCGLA